MKLAWQIACKDLVRLRWILVLWGVVLVTSLALATIQSGLDRETYFPFYLGASIVTAGLLPLMAFGLVMGLLHDDPVAEIDAFWITRPISGGDLLRAKTLAAGLLALIPVLVALPFWLSHDFGGRQLVAAAWQTLRSDFIVVALALPFAVVSANGSKFVMHVMLAAGGLVVLALVAGLGHSAHDVAPAPAVEESRAWLVVGLWLAATLFVTLNQFFRRRTRQSLAVFLAVVVAGFAVEQWWPWPFGFVTREAAAPAAVAGTPVAVDAPVFSARIAGLVRPMRIVAEAPLREGTSASRHGRTLKIQTVLFDFTGLLQVEFSETVPRLSARFRDLLPGAPVPPGTSTFYFILNRHDGRAIAVEASRAGSELKVAALGISHLAFSVRPAAAWHGNAPADTAAWLKDAALIEVIPDDLGAAQPVASMPLTP